MNKKILFPKHLFMYKDECLEKLKQQIRMSPYNQISEYSRKQVKMNKKRVANYKEKVRKEVLSQDGLKFTLNDIYQKFDQQNLQVKPDQKTEQDTVRSLDRWNKITKARLRKSNRLDNLTLNLFSARLVLESFKQIRKYNYKQNCVRIGECSKYYQNQTRILQKWMRQEQSNILERLEAKQKRLYQLQNENQSLKNIDNSLNAFIRDKKKRFLSNISSIDELQLSAKNDVKDLKAFKLDCILLYKNILSLGYDVRSHGISWVIYRLRELGESVDEHDLPSYMDEKARKYIIEITNLQEQIESVDMKRKELLQLYNREFNSSSNRISFQNSNQVQGFTLLDSFRVRQQEEQVKMRQITSRMQKEFSKSAWGWQELKKLNLKNSSFKMGECKTTSGNLIYKQVKRRLKAQLQSNKQIRRQYFSESSAQKQKLADSYYAVQKIYNQKGKQLHEKSEKEKKRLLGQLKWVQSDPTRLIAQIAGLFGVQTAQKVLRANQQLRKMME